MREDRYGLPVSTKSDAALDAYALGVELTLTLNAGAEIPFRAAIAADPDFALAHAGLARHLQLHARMAEAREAASRAVALAASASPRERGHAEIVGLAVNGQSARALEALRAHIAGFPRDAVPLSLALGVYGLIGFSGRKEHHREQRALLESLAPHWRDDGWFLGFLGWSHAETGEPEKGARITERALALKPRNAHAAHARAHSHVEQGQAEPGLKFLAAWIADYDPASQLHGHLSWHVALWELDLGRVAAAFDRYLWSIQPARNQSAPMPALADAASFLWRCKIYGTGPTPPPWTEVAEHAQRFFPKAGLPFADLHAAMASAAAGDRAALDRRIAELEQLLRDGKLPQGPVIPALCRMLGAFARGDDGETLGLFEQARDDLPRMAGSHAQRELFEDTAIIAALRANRAEPARGLLQARLARRPRARDSAWLARLSAT